jgi:hypothetical protein
MLYPQLLDGNFGKLPGALREFHSRPGGGKASGRVSVRHASSLLARLVGFPPSGDNIPLQLEVVADENSEVWIRRFGGVELRTTQRREGELLLEMFGPVRMFFRILADERGMRFECQRARLWGIPLPLRVMASVWGDATSWEVEVTVGGVGSYRGTLVAAP